MLAMEGRGGVNGVVLRNKVPVPAMAGARFKGVYSRKVVCFFDIVCIDKIAYGVVFLKGP